MLDSLLNWFQNREKRGCGKPTKNQRADTNGNTFRYTAISTRNKPFSQLEAIHSIVVNSCKLGEQLSVGHMRSDVGVDNTLSGNDSHHCVYVGRHNHHRVRITCVILPSNNHPIIIGCRHS